MSILLAANTAGELLIPAFFSAPAGTPLTLAFSIKMDSAPITGFNAFNVMSVEGGVGFTAGSVAQSAATVINVRAETRDATTSSTVTLDKTRAALGNWVKVVCVFNSNTNKIVYSVDGSGNLVASAVGTSNRAATGEVNLKLLGTWLTSALRVNNLTVYKAGLTSAQALELMTDDSVAGLAPYAKWDTTNSWSATIPDTSGNGRSITPPVTWSFSSDNPLFSDEPNTPPVIEEATLAGFSYELTPIDNDGAVSYEAYANPSHGSLALLDNVVTYTTNETFAGNDTFTVTASDETNLAYNTMTLSPAGEEDIAPNPFSFGSVNNAPISQTIYSPIPVFLSGMTPSVDSLAVPSGGLNYRVKPSGGVFGSWLTTNSNVQNGAEIEASLLSSPDYETQKVGTLTIGGVAGTFAVTTMSEVEPTPSGGRGIVRTIIH